MVYSGDVGWSQGVSPMHHGRSGGADGEPVSAAENRCLDLQENLVEAIERAAAALRVVHDESQSRELRSLITIRERTDDLLNQLANLAQCRGDKVPTLNRLERARLDLVSTIREEMPFIIFEQSLVQEALNFATLSDSGSEPGTPAPPRGSSQNLAGLDNRAAAPVTFPFDSMQTPSTVTADSRSPEFRESPTSVIPGHRDHRDEGARKGKAVAFASTTDELLTSGGGVLIPPPPLFFPPDSAETHTQAEFRRGYGGTPGSAKMAEEEWPDREYAAQPDPQAHRSRGGSSFLPQIATVACVAAAGIGAFLLRERVAEGATAVASAVSAQASAVASRVAERSRISAARAEAGQRRKEMAEAARRERAAAQSEQRKRAQMAKAAQREAELAAASLVAEQRAIAEQAAAAKRAAAERKQRALAAATAAAVVQTAAQKRTAPPARAPLGEVTNTVAQSAVASASSAKIAAAASSPAPLKLQQPEVIASAPLRRPAEYLSGLEGGAHALVEVRWTPHVSLGRG